MIRNEQFRSVRSGVFVWWGRYFQRLAGLAGGEGAERARYEPANALAEARQCADLLSQAQWHVARARRQHDEEVTLRDRQREQREAFRRQQVRFPPLPRVRNLLPALFLMANNNND